MGVNEIAGVHGRLLPDFVAGAGFAGIAVSLIGRNHPLGIVLASLLFGALYQGGSELAFEINGFSRDMVFMLQGLIVPSKHCRTISNPIGSCRSMASWPPMLFTTALTVIPLYFQING